MLNLSYRRSLRFSALRLGLFTVYSSTTSELQLGMGPRPAAHRGAVLLPGPELVVEVEEIIMQPHQHQDESEMEIDLRYAFLYIINTRPGPGWCGACGVRAVRVINIYPIRAVHTYGSIIAS